MTTVDEWLEICQKELSPEEVASVQKVSIPSDMDSFQKTEASWKTLADLEPAHGLSALVQPSEIAKFIAGWFIGELISLKTVHLLKVWFSEGGLAAVSSSCAEC